MSDKLFSNEILSGLVKVKKCIAGIEAPLKKRGVLGKKESLEPTDSSSKIVSLVENMKSDSFYGVSINDFYSFNDGVLEEITENADDLVGFKMGTKYNHFTSRTANTNSQEYLLNNYKSIGTGNSLNGKYMRKKAVYGNHTLVNPYVNAFGRNQYGTTIIQEDDYNYAFMNSPALSSAEINTMFCTGGFNYAFCNCKNLKEVVFNIKYAHREIPDFGDANFDGGYGSTRFYKTYDELPKKDTRGFNFSPDGENSGLVLETFSSFEYNKWVKLTHDTRGVHGGPFLKNAFEGCTALRRIAFPTLYKDDIILTPDFYPCTACNGRGGTTINYSNGGSKWQPCSACNGTGKEPQRAHFSTKEDFTNYFGLNTVSADVVFEFKDGAFHIDEMYNN